MSNINDVVIEIAFGVEDSMTFGEGQFGTDAFRGTLAWTDVTPWVREASTFRGMNSVRDIWMRADAGSLSITLDNSDARFDPLNLEGPYVDDYGTQVLPMKPIRVRVDSDPEVHLWRGYIDNWGLAFPMKNHDAVVSVTATDAISVLSNFNGPARVAQGASETTGARIDRILDNASWPESMRVIETGAITVQETTLSQSAWAEMQLVSDTEVGELYIDGQGRVVFRDVGAIFTDTRSTTPQGAFSDDGTELVYVDVERPYDFTTITNMVRIGRVDGEQQVAEDFNSQTRYQIRTYERTDLLYESDFQSQQTADFILFVLKDPRPRYDRLVINPMADPDNLFPQVWEREFGDRITVSHTPKGLSDPVERDCYIRGISHQWSPGNNWQTIWILQDTTRYDDWADQEGI